MDFPILGQYLPTLHTPEQRLNVVPCRPGSHIPYVNSTDVLSEAYLACRLVTSAGTTVIVKCERVIIHASA